MRSLPVLPSNIHWRSFFDVVISLQQSFAGKEVVTWCGICLNCAQVTLKLKTETITGTLARFDEEVGVIFTCFVDSN